jgi:hypothetical protein
MKAVDSDLLAVMGFAQVALALGSECGFDVGFAVRDGQWFDLLARELATAAAATEGSMHTLIICAVLWSSGWMSLTISTQLPLSAYRPAQ